ncbi:protein-L-isoaspartate O-methyltransferase [Nesterenkonia sp. F]|uniref:protein-L-isoaspartate O-methyltransferase family protein n=1 Tax=Nesterenkonia sp. F TaxID=795955 RepID=UPI000A07B23B|nr:methyltransferase domain-containing protein [Nesterenkonia sp. F]
MVAVQQGLDGAAGDAVARAMVEVPRVDFLPDSARPHSAADEPLAIGCGQTNSQPTTVARMLRLLDVRPGQRVLDVGTGSGWTAVLLGRLVGEAGMVHGVELEPDLAASAERAVAARGPEPVQVHVAVPRVLGLPEHAPFDRILVSADAPRMPEELVEQLVAAEGEQSGGVMVVPVRGEMHRVRRDRDGLEVTRHGQYRFVPLR